MIMPHTIIHKEVNIYKYPEEFEGHLGSVTLGDLHGNTLKLLHFLLRHDVIKFKNFVADTRVAYQEFVGIYEKINTISSQCIKITRNIKELLDVSNTNSYVSREVGDRGITCQQTLESISSARNITTNSLDEDIDPSLSPQKLIALQQEEKTAIKRLSSCIDRFQKFLSKIEIKDNSALVRLIGDEVADRGSNDYFTLKMLGLLKDNNVQVTIIISNHGREFVTAYENLFTKGEFTPQNDIQSRQIPSFHHLKLLIDEKIVSQDEITDLINRAYKPTLKLLDYTQYQDVIRIFTHAPVTFDIIHKLAVSLDLNYNDSSKENLGATIHDINNKFQTIVRENRVHEYCHFRMGHESDSQNHPFLNLIWNRWDNIKDNDIGARPPIVNGFHVNYIHGHDSHQSQWVQVTNLDTICGKFPRNSPLDQAICQPYIVIISDEKPLSAIELSSIRKQREVEERQNKGAMKICLLLGVLLSLSMYGSPGIFSNSVLFSALAALTISRVCRSYSIPISFERGHVPPNNRRIEFESIELDQLIRLQSNTTPTSQEDNYQELMRHSSFLKTPYLHKTISNDADVSNCNTHSP